MLDIIFSILCTKYSLIFFDVFSGQAFKIVQIGSLLAKIRSRKQVFTLRGGALIEFTEKNKNTIIKTLKRATYIQTPSLFLKEYFDNLGFKIYYLPNPINLEKFPFKRDDIIENSILWVRAFKNIYNPDLAVKILYEVRKTNPSATLTMIGPNKGTLNETIKLIKNLGLEDSIKIIGPVKNELLFNYYQTHEVYLNTTSYESFGVAIVEAASCGIPIVSTSVGEIPYLWDQNKEMMMISKFEPDSLAQIISYLFLNPELASEMAANAQKKALGFSWDSIKDKWEKIFNDNNEV